MFNIDLDQGIDVRKKENKWKLENILNVILNLNPGLNKIYTNLHLKFVFEIFFNKVISVFKLFIIQIYKNEFVKIRTSKNFHMPMCVEENKKGLKNIYDKYRL